MTLFTYINNNIVRIKYDIKIGLIPCSILHHWAIYSRYDYYKKLGNSICLAAFFTAEDLKVSEIWVKIIKKRMEQEI
jgi:hypothetical protein